MKIAIPNYLLTNEGLQIGDRVFPMTHGWTDGIDEHGDYYVMGFIEPERAGFPDDPHIILDLHYSRSKPYEVKTDHGFGPRESYFKLINNKTGE